MEPIKLADNPRIAVLLNKESTPDLEYSLYCVQLISSGMMAFDTTLVFYKGTSKTQFQLFKKSSLVLR
mgnify:FL=1